MTKNPFAVNVFANHIPKKPNEQFFESMQDFLEKICIENHLGYERQSINALKFYSYTGQISCLLSENIPIVSFTFGTLDDESIKSFKQRDVILIGTATCLKEAEILDHIGTDVMIAQGIEAGGHRGTFLEEEPLPMIGSVSLIPQLANKIGKPIIAAGGIHDGRTLKTAFIVGAKGVQIGTALLPVMKALPLQPIKSAAKCKGYR